MSVLTSNERHALVRAIRLLNFDKKKFLWAVLAGAGAVGSGLALGATSAWLIARAAQLPPVLTLSVAATAVRAFGIGKALFRYLERIASHWVALYGMSNLRTRLYDILAHAPTDAVTAIKRGDLLARTGSDVDDVGEFIVKSLLPATVATIISTLAVGVIAFLSIPIAIVLLLCMVLSGIVSPYIAMQAARMEQRSHIRYRADLNALSLTMLESAAELQVSGQMEAIDAARHDVENRLHASRDRSARAAAWAKAIDLLALALAVLGALFIGTRQVASGDLSGINLVVCVLTPLAAFEATQRMIGAATQLVRSASAAERIISLLDSAQYNARGSQVTHRSSSARHNTADHSGDTKQESECDASADSFSVSTTLAQPTPLPEVGCSSSTTTNNACGNVEFSAADGAALIARDLVIGWPDGPDIAGPIDLELRPGHSIAIVGASGIGKSTLLYTLAGMIPPHSGLLTLNGRAPASVDRREISHEITLTAEDAHVFETSVLENLRVARADIDSDTARHLLERAGLGSWLEQLPNGVETMLGSDATSISGGERRRLLLARALAGQSTFMLLDEPGEHLDTHTADQLIRDLLRTSRDGHGIIVVTHRLTPLDEADEVIMLGETGKGVGILARGTHHELRAQLPQYDWSLNRE
ncbi:amino acid ABC transporter ATP-binding/permease protein [Trueperella sp. LYQ143]|uniref:amino acid ABC transporter ATP-binding/permease protein n=1 Tax=Trueperella sp. LYQ143 TaxID=3391059 RepID=UPI00398321CC